METILTVGLKRRAWSVMYVGLAGRSEGGVLADDGFLDGRALCFYVLF